MVTRSHKHPPFPRTFSSICLSLSPGLLEIGLDFAEKEKVLFKMIMPFYQLLIFWMGSKFLPTLTRNNKENWIPYGRTKFVVTVLVWTCTRFVPTVNTVFQYNTHVWCVLYILQCHGSFAQKAISSLLTPGATLNRTPIETHAELCKFNPFKTWFHNTGITVPSFSSAAIYFPQTSNVAFKRNVTVKE